MLSFARPVPVARYAGTFGLALAASVALTQMVRRRAVAAGLFDWPDGGGLRSRRPRVDVPRAGIPRIGGVAIAVAVLGALVIGGHGMAGTRDAWASRDLVVLLGGGLGMHAIGLADDLRPLRARWKFVAQLLVATLVWAAGLRLAVVGLPGAGVVALPHVWSLIATVVWLVAITNAINLLDGLDGLAAGATACAAIALCLVAHANRHPDAVLASVAVAGAAIGFLYFNFYPATIFLGDSGSLFLGFMLGGIGMLGTQAAGAGAPAAMAGAALVVVLGLPVLDTSLAVLRRLVRGRPIFAPDREHIHHRLLDQLLARGYSPRVAVLTLYAVCVVLALCGMWLVSSPAAGSAATIVAVTDGGP
jgi:UDP-GlcNAc:undecaprenyl-phosphate GlcNAc-1-phosphate transferase